MFFCIINKQISSCHLPSDINHMYISIQVFVKIISEKRTDPILIYIS